MCVNEVRLEKKWQKKVENPPKLVILSLWPFHLRIEEQLQLINGNIKRWEIRVSWLGQSTSTGFVPLNCLQQGPWITVLTQRWQPSTSCLWLTSGLCRHSMCATPDAHGGSSPVNGQCICVSSIYPLPYFSKHITQTLCSAPQPNQTTSPPPLNEMICAIIIVFM